MELAVRSERKRRASLAYTKRVQTVLTEEQYELLLQIAQEERKPVSVLLREAIVEEYFKEAALKRRRAALKSLRPLRAPGADWAQMEREIIQGTRDE